jgi:chemotaxis protein CheD
MPINQMENRTDLIGQRGITEIEVKMGSLHVTDASNAMLTTFVGSCIALCIHDPVKKIGGLAHIMLPDSQGKSPPEHDYQAKYGDHALNILIDEMIGRGANLTRVASKIAGGARMFSNENKREDAFFDIGQRNLQQIKLLLESRKIPVLGQDVGSAQGRWVRLDVNTGQVIVRKKGSKDVIL